MTAITAYAELPIADDGVRHSWGLWGEEDTRGTVNRIDAASSLRGLAAAREGLVFSLNAPLDVIDPPLFGRPRFTHDLVEGTNGALNDRISNWNTQSSSQWDGLSHVQWHGHGRYNGLSAQQHGIHHVAERPIVTRAVLVDIPRFRAGAGRSLLQGVPDLIEVEEIEECLKASHAVLEPGDILLVRTGWLEWYRSQPDSVRTRLARTDELVSPGLSSREATAAWLWNSGIAAVAGDNPVLETWPQGVYLDAEDRAAALADPRRRAEVSLHARLLPALGMPIGELWDLATFADWCAGNDRCTALLTSAPLNLIGGAASPANALVIV